MNINCMVELPIKSIEFNLILCSQRKAEEKFETKFDILLEDITSTNLFCHVNTCTLYI